MRRQMGGSVPMRVIFSWQSGGVVAFSVGIDQLSFKTGEGGYRDNLYDVEGLEGRLQSAW